MSRLVVFAVLAALCASAVATCMIDNPEQIRDAAADCQHVLLHATSGVVLREWNPAIALSIISSLNERRTVYLDGVVEIDDLVLYGVNFVGSVNATLRVGKRLTAIDCAITNIAVRVLGSARATVAFSSLYAREGPVFVADADTTVLFANNALCDRNCVELRVYSPVAILYPFQD